MGSGERSTSSPPSSSAAPHFLFPLTGDENVETSRGALRPREGGGLLVHVVACAMVCGRGVRVDGEALASPLTLICAGEAPASAGAEEPRRRIGGGSTPSASGGCGGAETAARIDALHGERRQRPHARARCSCVPLPSFRPTHADAPVRASAAGVEPLIAAQRLGAQRLGSQRIGSPRIGSPRIGSPASDRHGSPRMDRHASARNRSEPQRCARVRDGAGWAAAGRACWVGPVRGGAGPGTG